MKRLCDHLSFELKIEVSVCADAFCNKTVAICNRMPDAFCNKLLSQFAILSVAFYSKKVQNVINSWNLGDTF